MSGYKSIKDLVIETSMNEGRYPSYESLTAIVLEYFPNSRWKKSHYAFYKHKIKTGEMVIPGLNDSGDELIDAENDDENEVAEAVDASISLERDLHSYFAARIDRIEEGLVLLAGGVEYQTEAGRIDLLAKDSEARTVVIELKAGKAKDNALGQLLGYMGCIGANSEARDRGIRGILVASNFEPRVVYAASGLPAIKLVRYRVSFELEEVV